MWCLANFQMPELNSSRFTQRAAVSSFLSSALGSSSFEPIADLNSLIACPIPLPTCGSFPTPKSRRTIKRIKAICQMPKFWNTDKHSELSRRFAGLIYGTRVRLFSIPRLFQRSHTLDCCFRWIFCNYRSTKITPHGDYFAQHFDVIRWKCHGLHL